MAKILLIEDDRDACDALAEGLRQAGYAVRACYNGSEAIELYRRERSDVVFCDLKLPGIDGLSVLEALKAMDPWSTVIMVTGYGTVDTATRSLRLGAYDYVEKPCSIEQLKHIAKQALEHRRQMKEISTMQGKPGTAADIPARLVELEQLKADFLTMVIEELRAPMRQLHEALGLAEKGFYGTWEEARKKEFLQQIGRVEAALSRLFLAGFALFLSHEQRVTITDGDVVPLTQEILQELEPRVRERGLSLQTELSDSPLKGPMDMEKVAYILRELMDNAIKFTPGGGSVTVACAAEPKGFRLEVSDTGCGILPERQDDLFTVFRQSAADRRMRRQKSGLGLPLVRHYVDLLNGTIKVESKPGESTRFTVTLPWWEVRPK